MWQFPQWQKQSMFLLTTHRNGKQRVLWPPLERFTETASLLISRFIRTNIDKKLAVRVTYTTESPYTIKKNTPTAEFSVVTPEQSKFVKPKDTEILNMIPDVIQI